jgi:EAL domain-containing protein (putative c-di-GMP-specific phosphodiesterase class I)
MTTSATVRAPAEWSNLVTLPALAMPTVAHPSLADPSLADPSLADGPEEPLDLQQAVEHVGRQVSGESVGRVAAALAGHPRLRPLHSVPAFIEWIAREISAGRIPEIASAGAGTGGSTGVDADAPTGLASWDDLLDHALSGRDVEAFLQPIVDLRSNSVVGYEALARFTGRTGLSADHWFGEAARRGLRNELEALALRAALSRRRETPRGCFLSMNVSPHALGTDAVARVLAEAGDLHGLVIELTVPVQPSEVVDLAPRVDAIKRAGAKLALSYADPETTRLELLTFRPAVLKLTEATLAEIGTDGAHEAGRDTLDILGRPLGPELVVQGVERIEDLTTLRGSGVWLAQGFLVGVPTTQWHPLASAIGVTKPQ